MANKFTCLQIVTETKASKQITWFVVMTKPTTRESADYMATLLKESQPDNHFQVIPVEIARAYVNVLGAEYLVQTEPEPEDDDYNDGY